MNILLKPFYKFSTSIGEKFFVVTHHYVKDMYYERSKIFSKYIQSSSL